MRRGPDFLGIGATRTASTYLYEQLRSHPGIWLPPKKEVYYFSYQRGRRRGNRRQREHLPELAGSLRRALGGARDGWSDVGWGLRYLLGRPNDRWYLSLFPELPDRVAGQIEPTYATLPKDTIAILAGMLPHLRLVFTMRDPIDRAWSTATKQLARFHGRPMESFSDGQVLDKLARQGVPMSRYLELIERWEAAFAPERFLYGFYEELLADPARFVDRVSIHVGAGPHPALDAQALRRRVNDTSAHRTAIPARFERYLAEHLLDATARLAARFGGPAEDWLRRMHEVLSGSRP